MLTKEEIESLDSYNKLAKQFSEQKSNKDFWADEFKLFNELLPEGKILDLGCGWGRDSFLFNKNKYTYIGVDISPSMIEEAKRQYSDREFLVQDFYKLDFPSKYFDGFWSAVSLIQVPKLQLPAALNSLKKVLKKGAIGFFSGKKGKGEGYESMEFNQLRRYFAYYNLEEMREVLSVNGFSVVNCYEKISPVNSQKKYLCYFIKYD